ncbi:MAG: glycosyltransferase [Bdellovibrionales bacterium CG10_big_fil_rev_8_21_14_0_10_45_34]|nr:MAG: glycosyltransferase [Bdellovibrionales bacterium CG10_big_fil_rev_8_21_14_0_10_45_34]
MAKQVLPENLRVCLVARKFPTSSVGEFGYLWSLASQLAQKGHEVVVIASEGRPEHEYEKETVKLFYLSQGIRSYRSEEFASHARIKFLELHSQKPFDLLHGFDASATLIARLRENFQIATVFDVRATQLAQIFSILGVSQESLSSLIQTGIAVSYKFLRTYYGADLGLLKSADAIFVRSQQERLALERFYFYPDSRIFTVPFGIDSSALSKEAPSEDLRKKWGIAETCRMILTITDMTEVREVKNLLLSFEKVVIKKPDLRLMIIGNGPKRKEIEYQIYNLALGNKVILVGAIDAETLSNALFSSEVLISLSSRSMGFESTLLEAMVYKKIVIGSEVNGAASSIIEDGVDGFLVRPADVSGISNLLLDIFSGKVLTVEIGERARKKVVDLFEPQKVIDATVQAYYKILKRAKRLKSSFGVKKINASKQEMLKEV